MEASMGQNSCKAEKERRAPLLLYLNRNLSYSDWEASGRAWGPRRLQDGFKTPKVPHVASKIMKKSTKMSPKSSNFGLGEGLGGILEGLWEGLGAKTAPGRF